MPFDITTFPVSDPVAIALGAKPLKAEESDNYSLGAVVRFGKFSLTADAYQINVDDRIVLSENLTQTNVRAYLQAQGFIGSGGGRFFINGVDTETQGLDIVANYAFPETSFGQFDVTFGANFSSTDVTAAPAIPVLSTLNPAPELFSRVNVLTYEKGQPKDKFNFSLDWDHGPFGATLRAVRYGEVLSPGTSAARLHGLGQDGGRPGGAGDSCRAPQAHHRRRQRVRRIPRCAALHVELDRQHAVLGLLAVRLLGAVHLRPRGRELLTLHGARRA